jgi:NAD(P)H-dependent FMN reductase
MNKRVGIISGSLRCESANTILAKALVLFSPDNSQYIDISNIPLYNQDLEKAYKGGFPTSVEYVQAQVRECTHLILCIPENTKMPSAAMKNFIDWMTRGSPTTRPPLIGKSIVMVSAAGRSCGIHAQESLTKALELDTWLELNLLSNLNKGYNIYDGKTYFDNLQLVNQDVIDELKALMNNL